MIASFKTRDTETLFNDGRVKRWEAIEVAARRKLVMLHAAKKLDDLKIPPGNRLHKLSDDRAGQHAIRINDQYRVCFV
ncbi:MAG TPA: type II toxin-antitoxin system RelE/ParE family toxin [Candidatus Acidoferrales bacterium]